MDITFSNKASDLDNVAKPLLDALQRYFEFNDKYVYELHLYKRLAKKGDEQAIITIEEYTDGTEEAKA